MQIAIENGYTKVLLGTCTSRIACHVLQATVKVGSMDHSLSSFAKKLKIFIHMNE